MPSDGNMMFTQLHTQWIAPELERRKGLGKWAPDDRVFRALVRFPRSRPPVVDLNDEIPWMMLVDMPEKDHLKLGDTIYWEQVQNVANVEPPNIDGERVAFVYLYKVTKGYRIMSDFSPFSVEGPIGHDEWRETYGPAIAATLQSGHVERSVNLDAPSLDQLRTLGLWPAPALVPYPFQEILRRTAEGDLDGARAKLLGHCTPDFLTKLSDEWWVVPEFAKRRASLTDALQAHREGRYTLSVAALVPQLEGLITDRLVTLAPANDQGGHRQKVQRFRDNLIQTPDKTVIFRKVVEAALSFVSEGPAMANFRQWDAVLDNSFPNRHAVAHGRHEEAMYTEESSVKLILLLDTLCCMMKDGWQNA